MKALGIVREACAAASLLFLFLLVTSGWGLMAAYVPSDHEAFATVLYLRKQAGAAGFLRSVHYQVSSALVVSGFLYLVASFLEGRLAVEKKAWWVAVGAYLLVLGLCFTGYLLPMDQNAYWGTAIRLGIVGTMPVAGGWLADLLRGGATVNASTLPRFHALHVSVFPFLLLVLLLLLLPELAALARGSEPGRRRRPLLVALVLLVLAFASALAVPAPLEPRAAPADTAYVPRPEWYFVWLFQLGKYLEGAEWIRSALVPAAGAALLVALPYLRPGSPRLRAAAATGLLFAAAVLTGLSRWEDRVLPAKPSYEEALATRAAGLYHAECVSCHGAGGKGDGSQARAFRLDARDFTQPDFWREVPEERMRESIRNGRREDMPAFGRKLSEEEIDGLLALLRSRFRPAPVP